MYRVQSCNLLNDDSASAGLISVATVGMVNPGSVSPVSMGAAALPDAGVEVDAPWGGAPGPNGSAVGNVLPENSPCRGESRPEEANVDGSGLPFVGGGLPEGVGGSCLFLPFLGGVVDMGTVFFALSGEWEFYQMVVVKGQEADDSLPSLRRGTRLCK